MPDSGDGRYTFSKVAEGFLRLDTQTGEVSVCSQRAVGWACQAVPEDRAVLENEIARLRNENATLKKDILAHGLPLPAGAMPEPPSTARRRPRRGSGAIAEVDRMVALCRTDVASVGRRHRSCGETSTEQELIGRAS